MKRTGGIIAVSAYKLFVSILRIVAGILILLFGDNIHRAIDFFVIRRFFSFRILLVFLSTHIRTSPPSLTFILAVSIILLSTLDILFILVFLARKRWGALGFFIISILWIPVELLFVSKFLVAPSILVFLVDIIIIVFLFRILTHPKGYFKK